MLTFEECKKMLLKETEEHLTDSQVKEVVDFLELISTIVIETYLLKDEKKSRDHEPGKF